MKWNWGTKLFIGAALFMIMLIVFGVLMMRESVSLVEKDYYPKGQEFQKQIERRDNALPFAEQVLFNNVEDQLQLTLPGVFCEEGLTGTLFMYNRADESKDANFSFSYSGDSIFVFPSNGMRGRYLAKITWKFGDKEYYVEKSIYLK